MRNVLEGFKEQKSSIQGLRLPIMGLRTDVYLKKA